MNKISSTGLNLVSKSVKENIEQTKSIQKEIINNQGNLYLLWTLLTLS